MVEWWNGGLVDWRIGRIGKATERQVHSLIPQFHHPAISAISRFHISWSQSNVRMWKCENGGIVRMVEWWNGGSVRMVESGEISRHPPGSRKAFSERRCDNVGVFTREGDGRRTADVGATGNRPGKPRAGERHGTANGLRQCRNARHKKELITTNQARKEHTT